MGKKSKRKTPEDPGWEDTADGQGAQGDDQQTEGAATTPSKQHKKHKKSKEKDGDIKEHSTEHSVGTQEQNTDKKEKKKKKKRKAGEDGDVQEDVKLSKPKKRKLGSEKDNSEKTSPSEYTGDSSSNVAEAVRNGNCKKEKKKKKRLMNEEFAVSAALPTDTTVNGSISRPEELTVEMNTGDGNTTKSGKVCKKHKKEKKKLKQDVVSTNGSDVLLETDPQGIFTDSSSQKKKKGKSKHSEDTPLVDSNVGTTEDDSTPKKDKKKKHKRNKSELEVEANENGLGVGSQENGTDSSEPKTERKKEKKAKLTAGQNEEKGADESNVSTEDSKENKRKKKKKKEKSEGINPVELTSNCEDSTENTNQKKKSKKKKKSQNVEEKREKTETADSDVKDQAAETKQKKKKRKSKDKEQNPEQETAGGEVCDENAGTADQKQKDDCPLNPGETQTDPGQTDSAQSAHPATIGQWSTSMFKDSERQSKFLRLLGGFKKAGDSSPAASGPKKGLFGSLQLKHDSAVGGQRALTHQAAQSMNRRLESDYERALTFSARGQRGIGLGFTPDPAEGKKFHIDVNRVASKTFV